MIRINYIVVPILLSFIAVGCTTVVKDDPMVIEAREAYTAAAKDPEVAKMAPVALEEANESLQATEAMSSKGASKLEIEHSVYMTKQRVQIAKQKAKLNAAEVAVERAREERKDVVLEARTREAKGARKEANEALRRAEELSKQIAELGAHKTERGLVLTLSDVLFTVNSAELSTEGVREIGKASTFLNQYPEYMVMIEGHTDSTGPDNYNQSLSEKRANSVKDALNVRGISFNRSSAIGFGETQPIASNDTREGRAQNRRVEIIFSDENGQFSNNHLSYINN